MNNYVSINTPKRNLNTIKEVLECDYIFVAVPTPMNDDGSISLDIVHNVLNEIDIINNSWLKIQQ